MEELERLVERARAGDLDAYGQIVGRFQDMAYGCAYAVVGDFHLAQDAAQEAFLEAYRSLDKLRDAKAFPGWFRRIVLHSCNRLTRRRQPEVVGTETLAAMASASPDPAREADAQEMKDKVLAAVQALPEHERMVTTLFYINGYSQEEIAGFLEVPVTTVKDRLHASRTRLKERMMNMVRSTLQSKALPENFASQLLMFPFPQREPSVKIVERPGEDFEVRCADAQSYFVPLEERGRCDWTFYDWPGGRLTGVHEDNVISSAKWGKGTLLRVWNRFTDFKADEKEEWRERYILVEEDACRFVALRRNPPGKLRLSAFHFAGGDPAKPNPLNLRPGAKWRWGSDKQEVLGAAQVTIGDRSWKCLKVRYAANQGKNTDGTPVVLAEWYVATTGRTVFFRRYNGPGYAKAGSLRSFESLKGMPEVEYEGIVFRHSYDCIPDIALEHTRS